MAKPEVRGLKLEVRIREDRRVLIYRWGCGAGKLKFLKTERGTKRWRQSQKPHTPNPRMGHPPCHHHLILLLGFKFDRC